MARLPSQCYLIQQSGGWVVLFEDMTEREVVRFDPMSGPVFTGLAMEVIWNYFAMSAEDKAFACFWAGYFCAHAGHDEVELKSANHHIGVVDGTVRLFEGAGNAPARELLRFDPADGTAAARAQEIISDSPLIEEDKRLAHFMSGYYYAKACT